MAHGEPRHLRNSWIIQPVAPPQGEQALVSGDFVLKQRLLPTGLVELADRIEIDKLPTLPPGTQLVKVETPNDNVYCQPSALEESFMRGLHLCFVDSDRDLRFEGWFPARSQTASILNIAGDRPKMPKALPDIAYHDVDTVKMTDVFFIGIERRNYFNIFSAESFMIAFGKDGSLSRITAPVAFKSREMPKQIAILGARFTALSEKDGKMIVSVDEAMPRQPFGIFTTRTLQ